MKHLQIVEVKVEAEVEVKSRIKDFAPTFARFRFARLNCKI